MGSGPGCERRRREPSIGRRGALLAFAACVAVATAVAQAPVHLYRVGYFANGYAPADGAPPAAFRQAMRELGYVEGRNVVYIGRWAELRTDRLAQIAREFVEINPEVIVAFGYPAADAARQVSSTIPIVVAAAGDPAATGLVASLARPGGNVTGISDDSAVLSAKRLELLKEVRPNAGRIAVLWNARNEAMTQRYREIEKAAGTLHINVQALAVRDPADFDDAFAAMSRERPDALLVVTDALTRTNQRRVLEYAAKSDVPAMYEFSDFVRDGGLISYGPRSDDAFRRLAVFVDRILRGARPADLPVEQPTEFELVINMKTANSLGVTIPPSVYLRASEVVR